MSESSSAHITIGGSIAAAAVPDASLVDHRIRFDRPHDGKYEITAELLVYRPELGSVVFMTDAVEQFVTPPAPLAAGRRMKQALWQLDCDAVQQAETALRTCLSTLRKSLPPPLPALEIVADLPR
jgi:hypothetical protein